VTHISEATAPPAGNTAAGSKNAGGLSSMLLPELKRLASSLGIKGAGAMRKSALVDAISAAQSGSRDTASARAGTERISPQVAAEVAATQTSVDTPSQISSVDAGLAPVSTDGPSHGFDSRSGSAVSADDDTRSGDRASERDSSVHGDSDRDGDHASGDDLGEPNRDSRGRDSRSVSTKRDQDRGRTRDRLQRSESGSDTGDTQGRDGGTQGRDGGTQGRDGGTQGRDGVTQGRDGGTQNADGQRSDNTQNRDGYRDDDRGGSRNSRRRNRNRDRFRDRDKRRDGNDAEPQVSEDDVLIPAAGILDLLDNYAFVRTTGYLPGPNDVYVAMSMVRKYGLRKGDAITGAVRQQTGDGERREKFNPMVRIDTVNGVEPEASRNRIEFSKLTPLYAQERLRLETEPSAVITRIIDIVAPVGKGQRGLIVSPSKAGKTLVLQAMANAITTNNPECHLMVVLVDERPEEVTDMQRAVKGEVIASTFARPAEDHTTVAELAIERAKRLVELGHDVVVLLDSITRLGRAYNLAAPASGRILSGGVDSSALYPPKRFFGAARNIEDGGSLTILATALIETGSKMDEVIFEEFKGTGNMELRLRREYADKRIFPAIDIDASGTRREDLLMSKEELQIVWKLRRVLSALEGQQALELLLEKLRQTKSNVEFLMQVNKTTPTASGLRNNSTNDD
jgi:transcription termination factor Rho